ncbi:hypothetical protein TrRE_jg8369 [Triparma retinervis]|uniref:Uncharacterized protein n=1 Tax=Triparma retinervis TaxID=2557542 RepID=A0A9W7FBI9_9STRA|nr:hypothetical protein TrRE_jg8369 [Triparma retinervis]
MNGRTLGQTVREALTLFRSGGLTQSKANNLYNKALLLEQAARESTPVKKASLSRGSSREIVPPPSRPAVDVQAAALRISESKSAARRLKSKPAPAKSAASAKAPPQAPSSTKSPKRSRANSDPEEYRPSGSLKRRKPSMDESATASRPTGRQARKSAKALEPAFGVGDAIIVTRDGKEVSGVIMTADDSTGKVDIELDSGEQLFGVTAGDLC